ncbi:MAG: hypothetical protein ACXQT4_02625 [Methanotrichaceae archaeon]
MNNATAEGKDRLGNTVTAYDDAIVTIDPLDVNNSCREGPELF